MNDKKTRFYIRVADTVLAELKIRAKQQGVPTQDLARYALERGLSAMALEGSRNELVEAAKALIALSQQNRAATNATGNGFAIGATRAGLKSILFIEQYLRCLNMKEPDPISMAERISIKKLKELGL